jgi:hypothetical protein
MIIVINKRFRVITAAIVCFALAVTLLAFYAAEIGRASCRERV